MIMRMHRRENRIMPNGFAIIRYCYFNPIIGDIGAYIYEIFYGYQESGIEDRRNKTISNKKAQELINTHNLTLVVNNEHGKVWE